MSDWKATLHIDAYAAAGDLEVYGFVSRQGAETIAEVFAAALREHYASAAIPTQVEIQIERITD